jgi:hypothetical protein
MRTFLAKIKSSFSRLKRWQQALVIVGLLLFFFAPVRGGGTNGDPVSVSPISSPSLTPPPQTSTPSAAPVASATATPSVASRCVAVSKGKLKNIALGLHVTGGGTLTSGYAVKSSDYAEVWFIAAVIDGPGMGKGVVGIWASNSLEPNNGLIFAIDAYAGEFTDWGLGSTTDANITQNNDGVAEAAICAGGH